MTSIRNVSSQIPDLIRTAVCTIITGKPDEVNISFAFLQPQMFIHVQVQAYLPGQIDGILKLANICAYVQHF
jgi:hypothetical protein